MNYQNNTIARIMPSFMDVEFLVHAHTAQDPKFIHHLSEHINDIYEWSELVATNPCEVEFIRHEAALTLINLCMPFADEEERLTTLAEILLTN